MLIRCPTCASGYDLAPELMPQGRILRCAHCRDAWVCGAMAADAPAAGVPATGASAGAEIVAEARFSPVSAEPRTAVPPVVALPRRRRPQPAPAWRPPSGLAASVLVAVLAAGAMAAVAGKARVVEAFPPSEALFATIGLPVNLSGLGLGEIRSTVETGDGPPTLTLEGHITNLRPGATPVPSIRIAVRDKSSRELYYWTAPAPKAQLAAGETVLFRSRLTAPPRDGQDLAVSFAEPAPGPRRMAEALPGDR